MTHENDTNDDVTTKADSGRGHDEKTAATVHDRPAPNADYGEDTFLVEYPDGEVRYEPNTPVNVALFDEDLYETLDGFTEYGDITLDASVRHSRYVLTHDGASVTVPNEYVPDVVDAVRSPGVAESMLTDVYYDILDNQVRQDTVESFLDRFPSDRIEVTVDGWVVDDTFLVNYEAENYLTIDQNVYIRQGDAMVETDERKEAVVLNLDIDGREEVGGTILTELEQRFLATVQCLLYPEDYLGASLVDDVEQARGLTEDDVSDAISEISEIATSATVSGFTDTKTGNHHGHGFDKHRAIGEAAAGTLDQTLGMTAEAIDRLYFNDYDHAAPHELLKRKKELQNAPFDIFEDDGVPNDDTTRWIAIEQAANSAPIAEETRATLDSMF